MFPTTRQMRNIATTADSPECISVAKIWLQECMADHVKCTQSQLSKESYQKLLLNRVLYVGAKREAYIFCNSNRSMAPYAALSHRWGGNIKLQLTSVNLKDSTKGIPLPDFPPTFRDAINVFRALRINFLWIDCLCIVQDSARDWKKQSAKMGSIYSDALLTIAADAAENSQAGFTKGN